MIVRNINLVTFNTANSTYLFTWAAGSLYGTLTGLTGTFAGSQVSNLRVDDFEWSCYLDGRVELRDDRDHVVFTSTRVKSYVGTVDGHERSVNLTTAA